MTGELLKEYNLSECTLSISCILKSIKVLLQCHYVLGLLVDGLPYNTVGSLSYN